MTVPTKTRAKTYLRWWLAAAVVGILLLALFRVLCFQGWWRPLRIQGGSMAMALMGRHFQLRCADCQRFFVCGVEHPPHDSLAVCPNCGFAENSIDDGLVIPGRRVLVDRFSFQLADPQPWQVVAFRSKDEAMPFAVKRIVAVGARQLEIREGDVFVDGQIQRKSMQQLMAVRIPVHDDRYRHRRAANMPRWQGSNQQTAWESTAVGYLYDPVDSPARRDPTDWLVYQQWTCWPHPFPPAERTQTAPIFDHYGYNQNVSRGSLHAIRDLMVGCQLQTVGRATIRLSDGYDEFDLQLGPSKGRCQLKHHGTSVRQASYRRAQAAVQVDFALCDRQVLVSVDGRAVIQYCFERSEQKVGPQIIAFGATEGRLVVRAPVVYRDIHYLGPGGVATWSCRSKFPGEGIFVLGDNVPISIDSRDWGDLAPSAVLGRVFRFPQ